MTTNAELSKDVKKLNKKLNKTNLAVKRMLDDLSKYGKIGMNDATDYLKDL